MPSEWYAVKFWIRNEWGYLEQKAETVEISSNTKTKHREAENYILAKYSKLSPEIITVKYI